MNICHFSLQIGQQCSTCFSLEIGIRNVDLITESNETAPIAERPIQPPKQRQITILNIQVAEDDFPISIQYRIIQELEFLSRKNECRALLILAQIMEAGMESDLGDLSGMANQEIFFLQDIFTFTADHGIS
jgi:hypothetical protein